MYQFYYADAAKLEAQPRYEQNLADVFAVTAIRPAMWEEHCLECAAPACFGNCMHYRPRSDGRCMRFENGIQVSANAAGCCGQAARIRFRKWANLMTILYPAMLAPAAYEAMTRKNQRLGKRLGRIVSSKLPVKAKWETIRTREYLRRRSLKGLKGLDNQPDAFVFHGYSFEAKSWRLILEIYEDHTPVFKTALTLEPGENLRILDSRELSGACAAAGYRVKLYPEDDLEAELEILWCDFVKGNRITADRPAAQVKCVVWDLDHTLWNGTLIETEDPCSLRLNPNVLETIKALDARGILQSVASKNDYDQAWPVVAKLGLAEYFLYPQIHWNAKSGSLEQIAKDLNLGVDALALIDDSPFERNQVRSMLPQVRVYDPAALGTLLQRPEFDVLVTEESRNRRAMYQAEEKRREARQASDSGGTVEFLKRCHLRVTLFTPSSEEEKLRCYELLVRTNQLNLSGRKYTPEEYEAVLGRPGHRNFAFSCRDDFGSYGIVGFGQYRTEREDLVFTEFAMSCRVAGKYLESAVFSFLLREAGRTGGRFPVQKTKKNRLLRNTLENIGFQIQRDSEEEVVYTFTEDLLHRELVSVEGR